MYLNQATVLGRVTRDPELKALPSGTKVVSLGVATNSQYKNKDGEKVEQVEYHNVVAFSKLAEIIGQYVKKGQLILIQGKLQTRTWEGTDGKKMYRTEILADTMQMGPKSSNSSEKEESDKVEKEAESGEIDPEDIPF